MSTKKKKSLEKYTKLLKNNVKKVDKKLDVKSSIDKNGVLNFKVYFKNK